MSNTIVGVLLVIVALIAVAALCYYFALRWDVLNDVKNAPRTEMFLCGKHGAFPAKYAIDAPVPASDKPIKICPMCMEDSEKKARELYAANVGKK